MKSSKTSPTQPGAGNRPKVVLSAADGARAEIICTAHTSPPGFQRAESEAPFSPKVTSARVAIRGGVPIIFLNLLLSAHRPSMDLRASLTGSFSKQHPTRPSCA